MQKRYAQRLCQGKATEPVLILEIFCLKIPSILQSHLEETGLVAGKCSWGHEALVVTSDGQLLLLSLLDNEGREGGIQTC
jgi:hypothetical protein